MLTPPEPLEDHQMQLNSIRLNITLFDVVGLYTILCFRVGLFVFKACDIILTCDLVNNKALNPTDVFWLVHVLSGHHEPADIEHGGQNEIVFSSDQACST